MNRRPEEDGLAPRSKRHKIEAKEEARSVALPEVLIREVATFVPFVEAAALVPKWTAQDPTSYCEWANKEEEDWVITELGASQEEELTDHT